VNCLPLAAGTPIALHEDMAAILCLVFLPLMMAAVGFIASGATFAGVVFILLSAFMVVAALNMARVWDGGEELSKAERT
jgi:hypothetical protein